MEKTKINKILQEMKNAKCCVPNFKKGGNCENKDIIHVSIPVKMKGLNCGLSVPLCFEHMSAYQEGHIEFIYNEEKQGFDELRFTDEFIQREKDK